MLLDPPLARRTRPPSGTICLDRLGAGAPGLLALLLLLLPSLPACGNADPRGASGEVEVVASIFPVADLARTIGGDDVRVEVLLSRGTSPATFEPTPATVRAVRSAGVLLLVGGGLEPWAAELAPDGAQTPTVRLLEGLELRGEGHRPGTGNPHLWLDPLRTRRQLVPRITDALSRVAPSARPRLEARARQLSDSLRALDGEIRAALEGLERRSFVASHPAWAYFADRYGLRQVGVVHDHPGQEPSPRGLTTLLADARAAGVPVVFGEPQVPDAAARTVAGELGVPLLPLDPLGGEGLEGRDSYLGLMRYNTAQIVRGLSGTPGGSARERARGNRGFIEP